MRTIGALWRKDGKKGDYLSGTLDLGAIGTINIAVFQNEKAPSEDDKKPDARIVVFDDD